MVREVEYEDLKLIEPRVELKQDFLEMSREFLAAGGQRYQPILASAEKDFRRFVGQLKQWARNHWLAHGFVPETTFWLVRGGKRILGTVRLRHYLTPALEHEGGHIGYDIRPSERGKGYGTLQLALTLKKARAMGMKRVLVTCDTDNLASSSIIEKNGGKLQDQVISYASGKPVSRYWIHLQGDEKAASASDGRSGS